MSFYKIPTGPYGADRNCYGGPEWQAGIKKAVAPLHCETVMHLKRKRLPLPGCLFLAHGAVSPAYAEARRHGGKCNVLMQKCADVKMQNASIR